jgi:hypothetical protein
MLGVVLQMWIDSETVEERRFCESIASVWYNGKMIRWGDEGDPPMPNMTDRTEIADNEKLKDIFGKILSGQVEN